ncbi:hypothetical protein, conserved [Leishmania lindenbergi]|uniref:DUF3456 domain-containing protein n=1 Tax=Leishmania lindenbergi TaxID=651832 RepID=A0AAW2ZT34_9TRYP
MPCNPRSYVSSTQPLVTAALLLLVCVLAVATGGASARKELPLNIPYPPIVQNALRCEVCSFIVDNALIYVQGMRDEMSQHRLQLREDDVLDELEKLCVPFKDPGQWIRQVSLGVDETKACRNADTSVIEAPRQVMKVILVEYYSKCGRTCDTVALLCEEWMDSGYMDDFPSYLVREANSGYNITSEEHRFAVFSQFCAPTPHCENIESALRELSEELTKNSELREAINADRPQEIKTEEREMEMMLHRLTREHGQSADVFSRDEVHRMKEAFLKGNREELKAIDPAAFDLTDSEFSMLQNYIRGEAPEEKEWEQQRGSSNPSDAEDL